jgi:hypothetical protein
VERWHRTLRRELLDITGPFAGLPSAQAAIGTWVYTYNHQRPHQAIDMAVPATPFRPGTRRQASPVFLYRLARSRSKCYRQRHTKVNTPNLCAQYTRQWVGETERPRAKTHRGRNPAGHRPD